ncbi:hypothetical protein DH2020_049856 [Rehmannia glutinosa]|uniref:Uncharacterized protein n=1 Tax=Rehmannia glutinosa TaxID=99300 RepID=A0ABR0U1M9_REHGL
MYVTRPISQLLKSPSLLAAPPDGPNSGYLVIQDEEPVTYSCFGWCKNRNLKNLPFPQDKNLNVRFEGADIPLDPLSFIPVLNQPLEAYTCSREEDKYTSCFFRCVKDVKPRPLDPQNIYQQFEIIKFRGHCFCVTSIAADGFAPYFLRRTEGWFKIHTDKTPPHFKLDIAQGLNAKLRARLPEFDFSLSRKSSEPVVVGKWYSPFMFVKEGKVRDPITRSMYYELTLEQRWEQVFTCCNNTNGGDRVAIDTMLEKEEVFVYGSKAVWNEEKVVDGVIWFTSYGLKGERMRVGLRVEIVERMKWEQARGGWMGGEKRRVKIDRVEKLKEGGEWSKFGLYVLVERFNLKRIDGSLVMFYDFKHFHQMKTKWGIDQ